MKICILILFIVREQEVYKKKWRIYVYDLNKQRILTIEIDGDYYSSYMEFLSPKKRLIKSISAERTHFSSSPYSRVNYWYKMWIIIIKGFENHDGIWF